MRKIFCIIILSCHFILMARIAKTQEHTVCPGVPDFQDIEKPWVTATYGTAFNPYEFVGIRKDRHTVIDVPGTDPVTGNMLKILPDGVDKVIRLGNKNVNAEGESLSYRFKVDPDKPVLLLNYAVVLEDPGHIQQAQPRFRMEVLGADGELIESCAHYNVYAGEETEDFNFYVYDNTHFVRWRDWTATGLDLSKYAGQEVLVRFTTNDCSYFAHFGYAYFYVTCIPERLTLESCRTDFIEIKAPDHFDAYAWNNGQTGQVSLWEQPEQHQMLSCELTSATGCRFTLYAVVGDNITDFERDTLIYDTVCEGDSYTKYALNLQQVTHSGIYTNSYIETSDCTDPREITLSLGLHVIPVYERIEAGICEGGDYTENGFHITQAESGILYDTLLLSASGRCPSYRVLKLNVASNRMSPRTIIGDQKLCGGNIHIFRVSSIEEGDQVIWEYPGKYQRIFENRYQINLISPQVYAEDTLRLQVTNKCRSYQASLPLSLSPSFRYFHSDTACTNEIYRKYDFVVPVQEREGSQVEVNSYKSVNGCDSVHVLELQVLPLPQVSIEAEDSVFCNTKDVKLRTKTGERLKDVAIGDVLCADGEIVSAKDFKASGKVARGIVFWVDNTGGHGWAVNIDEPPSPVTWGSRPKLPIGSFGPQFWNAITDRAGAEHTQAILDAGLLPECPAIQAVTTEPGWYLPAIGQLELLFSAFDIINHSLSIVGGKPLKVESGEGYWSSTQSATSFWMWFLAFDASTGINVDYAPYKMTQKFVRGIRDF